MYMFYVTAICCSRYCVHLKLPHPPPSPEGEPVNDFANASDNIYLQLYHLKLNCDQALVSVLQAPF